MVVAMACSNKIVILVAGHPVDEVAAQRGDFAAMIRDGLGPSWSDYMTIDPREPGALSEAPLKPAALIISGSADSVHSRTPWMLDTEAWLREVVAAATPVLGLCFGHQLLAQALGGEVQPNPRGREMGTVTISRTAVSDPLLEGVAEHFQAHACHVDSVTSLPPDATVLAHSAGDPHQCVRFAPTCYGVQFHPEFDAAVMRMYINDRAEQIRSEGLVVDELLAATSQTPTSARLLISFVERFVMLRQAAP